MEQLQRLYYNKRVNGFFLCLIIVHFMASVAISVLAMGGVEIGTFMALLMTQLLLLVPSFIFIISGSDNVFEWLRFRRLKTGTVFMVILFTFLTMPLISLINVVSQLFTTNTAVEMSAAFVGMPAALTVFMVGIFGPFCEDFAFRGIIFGGFRRSGAVLAGAVLSSVYFGLMHLNLNQMSYALVLGVVFCMLVEGTGSIWASITAHTVVNTWNVILLLVMEKVYSKMGKDMFELINEDVTTDQKLAMIGFLLVASLISSALAFGVFIAICRHEGRWEEFVSIFYRNKSGNAGEDTRYTEDSDNNENNGAGEDTENTGDSCGNGNNGICKDIESTGDGYGNENNGICEDTESTGDSYGNGNNRAGENNTNGKVRLLTPSGYIAIALCIFIIFFLDRILSMFSM